MSDVRWFVDLLSLEIPAYMTSRDLDDDGGPALAHEVEAYITDGEHTEECGPRCTYEHWARTPHEDHLWKSRYKRPMKRALHRLSRKPVPKGRPSLNVVLWALAAQDGNVDAAIASLRSSWAFMWQDAKARRWTSHALWELRRVYREDVPMRVLPRKSENQSIAEAEGAAA